MSTDTYTKGPYRRESEMTAQMTTPLPPKEPGTREGFCGGMGYHDGNYPVDRAIAAVKGVDTSLAAAPVVGDLSRGPEAAGVD